MGKCILVDMMLSCSHNSASVARKLLQSRKEDQKVFCNLIDKSSRQQAMHSLTAKLVFQQTEGNGGRRLDDAFGWGRGGLNMMEPPETTTTLTRADDARTFEFTIEFFPSKAKHGDGSLRDIEGDTIVKWEVELSEINPQELQSMEEKVVRNVVEKIGESIFWGPEQEVALLWFDNWKGEYVRIEDGEEMVDEIDRQNGWTTKQTMFRAELVDLKSDSKVGYVPSKLVAQMVDDDWASER
ncbi:hypothetical protein D1007_02569 [Hordeum vulgare]|nr:hypothetical protein D1007_02569 [Hordeum vulgare]